MKTSLKFILVVILSSIFVTSCSRKKDRFISRNYHAVTAEYNALYNGYLALEEGRQSLNDAYTDNYWDILPIERMQIIDEITLPGQSKNENFNRAEEKNALAISSSQSKPIDSYNQVKENYNKSLKNDDLKKCPEFWGGYSFTPYYFEFWEGHESRLNKREAYEKSDDSWKHLILQP